MKKIISFVGLFAVLGVGIGDAHGVAMSANIRRLLQEKQEKIEQLEKCEGKKQGWMIAGISTIGLTAVGVGVNIAQASKSNRLSNEIEMEKTTLQRQQDELDRISNQIADERAKKAEEERKRAEEEQRRRDEREKPRADEEVAGTISEECAKDKIWFPWNDGDKKCYSDEKKTSVVSCKCDNIPVVDAAGGQPGQGESQKPSAPQKPVSSATERIVGQDCTVEDLTALHAIRGHYITTGSKTKKCATSAGGALPAENNCSCATQECDTSSGYEMVKGQGWCKYVGKTGGSGQKPAETSKPGQGSSGGSGVATNGQSGGVKAEREQTDMKNKIPELSPISAGVLKSNLISDDKLTLREIQKVPSDVRIAKNSDENVEPGCEKYNHYDLKLSDGKIAYFYVFEQDNCNERAKMHKKCDEYNGVWFDDGGNGPGMCKNKKYDENFISDVFMNKCFEYSKYVNPYGTNYYQVSFDHYLCVDVTEEQCDDLKRAIEREIGEFYNGLRTEFSESRELETFEAKKMFFSYKEQDGAIIMDGVCTTTVSEREDVYYRPQ